MFYCSKHFRYRKQEQLALNIPAYLLKCIVVGAYTYIHIRIYVYTYMYIRIYIYTYT